VELSNEDIYKSALPV